MIPAGAGLVALAVLTAALVAIAVTECRANAREAAWWEELRSEALDDYGRLFDRERDS